MTARKHSPAHDFWHPRVEGQIRDVLRHHPEWFNLPTPRMRRTLINSLAKRIVGEIVVALVCNGPARDGCDCAAPEPGDRLGMPRDCGRYLESRQRGGGAPLPADGVGGGA